MALGYMSDARLRTQSYTLHLAGSRPTMSRCPFYGYRWPERSPTLEYVGGNGCGLDLEQNGPCRMELENKQVDYRSCEYASHSAHLIEAAKDLIQFDAGAGEVRSFAAWERDSAAH